MTHLCKCNPCRCNDHGAEDTDHTNDATNEVLAASSRRHGSGKRAGRRPGQICHGKAELSEPPLGAHLITRRRGYTHHGIYAGDGAVLHYAGLSRSICRGPVAQVSLAEFANGRPVQVECRSERALEGREIVARARSRLGESRYRLLTNNCEHFSEWSRFGVSRSSQVDRWIGLSTAVVRGLVSMVRWGSSSSMSSGSAERVTA
jgi:hypothetical protein